MYRTNKKHNNYPRNNYRLIAFQIVLVKYNHLDITHYSLEKSKYNRSTHHPFVKSRYFQIVLVKYNHLDNIAPFLAKIKIKIGTHHAIVK